MCLVIIGHRQHREWPLLIAANRDEFHARPTAPSAFWETHPGLLAGKDLEAGAVFAPLTSAADWSPQDNTRIHLSVNGDIRQDATLSELIWKIDEIISHLSGYYHLRPGDLILTGTPAGVGPVQAGDVIEGGIDGLQPIQLTLTDSE